MEIGREAYLVQSSDKLGRSTVPETFYNISPPISVLGVPFPCDTSTQQPGQAPFWDTVFFVSPFFFLPRVRVPHCHRGVWFMIVANPPQFPKYRNFYLEQGRLPISVFIKSLYSF